MKRILRYSFAVLWTSLLVSACTTTIQAELDAEVKRLCAKDGGIKVYEQVELPPDKFNQYGQINFFRPTEGDNSLGPEYEFTWETERLVQGNPQMFRYHIRVTRRADRKLLGELIQYSRGGGDMPGPWHASSFSCPNPPGGAVNLLLKSIFVQPR